MNSLAYVKSVSKPASAHSIRAKNKKQNKKKIQVKGEDKLQSSEISNMIKK